METDKCSPVTYFQSSIVCHDPVYNTAAGRWEFSVVFSVWNEGLWVEKASQDKIHYFKVNGWPVNPILYLNFWQVVVFLQMVFHPVDEAQHIAVTHWGSKTHSLPITIFVPFLRYYKRLSSSTFKGETDVTCERERENGE